MDKVDYYNKSAVNRDYWVKKNQYYHQQIQQLCQFIIPQKASVFNVGSGNGNLLYSLKPRKGVGVDISSVATKLAKKKFPSLHFITSDAEQLSLKETFEYILLSDVIGDLNDVQKAFEELHKVSNEKTRVVITYYSFLWEPILNFAEKIGLKMPQPRQNWLSTKDIANLLDLANFEIIKSDLFLLLPIYIPFISQFVNKYIARLPIIKNLCLVSYFVVRKKSNIYSSQEYTVSVIIPARNEEGNIENAVLRTPNLGKWTELIFIEKGSSDNTYEEIKRVAQKYKDKRVIRYYKGEIDTKGDKVRQGFDLAKGDILTILDSDLTTPPEDLPKFYQVIRSGKSEFVMGSRLIYPMENQAMRFLNILGNKFFSLAFSYLLNQPIKDTLCGTKVLFRNDYQVIAKNRSYFGNFDPFGDFDLIFGASKMNLKIMEVPIHYKTRTYGKTNISRFSHGWLLLKMTAFAAKKLKFV